MGWPSGAPEGVGETEREPARQVHLAGPSVSEASASASASASQCTQHQTVKQLQSLLTPEEVMSAVHSRLESFCSDSKTRENSEVMAWIIDGYVRHFSAERAHTCGYRSMQMVLSHVLQRTGPSGWPEAAAHIGSESPTVEYLSTLLEEGWRSGYDPEGADQLDHSATAPSKGGGKRYKWIGPTEMWVVLRSIGMKVTVYEFGALSVYQKMGATPRMQASPTRRPAYMVFALLWKYFSSHAVPTLTDEGGCEWPRRSSACPVILQFEGHSMVAIGAVRAKSAEGRVQRRILTLDPDWMPGKLEHCLVSGGDGWLDKMGLLIEEHDEDAYQLLTVEAGWSPSPPPSMNPGYDLYNFVCADVNAGSDDEADLR